MYHGQALTMSCQQLIFIRYACTQLFGAATWRRKQQPARMWGEWRVTVTEAVSTSGHAAAVRPPGSFGGCPPEQNHMAKRLPQSSGDFGNVIFGRMQVTAPRFVAHSGTEKRLMKVTA